MGLSRRKSGASMYVEQVQFKVIIGIYVVWLAQASRIVYVPLV